MSQTWQLNARRARRPARTPSQALPSLLTRVMAMNAAVLLIAGLALVLTPATVSDPVSLEEVVELVAGLVVLVLANLFLLRRAFAPLQRLTSSMGQIDHLSTGLRVPVYGADAEILRLTEAFNEMLDRLESERRSSFQRSAEAQESERRLVARELHDEVGQSLTALKLLLAQAARTAPDGRSDPLAEATQRRERRLGDRPRESVGRPDRRRAAAGRGPEGRSHRAAGAVIRILVVDDHPAVRAGLLAVLRGEPGLVPVGMAGSAEQALKAAPLDTGRGFGGLSAA